MPRPGSHNYDIRRAHERKRLENERVATDGEAGEEANRRLQRQEENRPIRQTERGRGPEGEREEDEEDNERAGSAGEPERRGER